MLIDSLLKKTNKKKGKSREPTVWSNPVLIIVKYSSPF